MQKMEVNYREVRYEFNKILRNIIQNPSAKRLYDLLNDPETLYDSTKLYEVKTVLDKLYGMLIYKLKTNSKIQEFWNSQKKLNRNEIGINPLKLFIEFSKWYTSIKENNETLKELESILRNNIGKIYNNFSFYVDETGIVPAFIAIDFKEGNVYAIDLFSLAFGSLEALINYDATKHTYRKGIVPLYKSGKNVTEFSIKIPKKEYKGTVEVFVKGYHPEKEFTVKSDSQLSENMISLCKINGKYPVVLDEYAIQALLYLNSDLNHAKYKPKLIPLPKIYFIRAAYTLLKAYGNEILKRKRYPRPKLLLALAIYAYYSTKDARNIIWRDAELNKNVISFYLENIGFDGTKFLNKYNVVKILKAAAGI